MTATTNPKSAREIRRATNRLQKKSQRAHKNAARQSFDDQVAHNLIAQATVRSRIEQELLRLRTRAGLLAHLGDDGVTLCDAAGRLIYTVAHAAKLHGLDATPESRILLGTANALADVAATPAALDSQRAAILSGLNACERLLPQLHTWSLCAGALELDQILSTRDFMTGDVANALDMNKCAAEGQTA